MSAFDDWAAGEGRDIVDFQTVRGLVLDADGLAADALDIRIRQAFAAGVRTGDGARITAEESSEIIAELSAALAVSQGENLKPCAAGCPGHLGPKAEAVFKESLAKWREIEASRAAGPWVPGEPPEECKASGELVLIWDRRIAPPPKSEVMHESPRVVHWWQPDWSTDRGEIVLRRHIAWHAHINPPKQEGGEG